MLSFVQLSICVIDSRAVYRHLYAKIHIDTTNMQARLVYLQRIVRFRGKVDITEGRCRWDRCMWNLLSRRMRFVALACCCTTHVACCCNYHLHPSTWPPHCWTDSQSNRDHELHTITSQLTTVDVWKLTQTQLSYTGAVNSGSSNCKLGNLNWLLMSNYAMSYSTVHIRHMICY